MGHMSLPPGFRFHPTDDELVGYYLKRRVDGLAIELEVIPVIDLYKFDPWQLPEKSFLPMRDMEWFFFCPRDRKYPHGSRTNRATASGYWKATGRDRKVHCESSVQGLRKTLVFHRGRAPGGERTGWVMHEYRLCEDLSQATPNFLGAFALCRVVKRNDELVQTKGKKKRSFVSTPNSSTESITQFLHNYPMDFNMETSMLSRTISPVPSYSNLAEDFFPSPLHSMDTYSGVQDTTLQDLEREMSSYINQPSIGFEACNFAALPSICRQESDADEEASWWLQEEGLLVGM